MIQAVLDYFRLVIYPLTALGLFILSTLCRERTPPPLRPAIFWALLSTAILMLILLLMSLMRLSGLEEANTLTSGLLTVTVVTLCVSTWFGILRLRKC